MSPKPAPELAKTRSQIRAYFAAQRAASRRTLRQLRATIKAAAPAATEHFSYGIPGFRLDGNSLIWYAAWKHHCSLYPVTAGMKRAHAKQLASYEMSKGTVRFPLNAPPTGLVRDLVKTRVAEIRRPKRPSVVRGA